MLGYESIFCNELDLSTIKEGLKYIEIDIYDIINKNNIATEEKANNIYKRILETSPEDTKTLLEILDIVSSDLGVSLIDKEELDDLKNKVNPQNFITPYNSEKVALANELYSQLTQDDLTYRDFLEVKEKAKQLF